MMTRVMMTTMTMMVGKVIANVDNGAPSDDDVGDFYDTIDNSNNDDDDDDDDDGGGGGDRR